MQPDNEIVETTIENDGEIAPIVIDFTQMGEDGQINESFLTMFGGAIKMIMQRMFGGGSIPITVRGNRRQVKSFAKTIAGEKNYYKNYTKYGLNNPKTYRSKFQLNKQVRKFERATGLKWPFK
tara:strand:- start:621 stop:989 length:369 start_codon:yes stop_codon:yes gene_type:complete